MLSYAQSEASQESEQTAVRAVIDTLFDGMRAGDSTAVRTFFHEEATLASQFSRQGLPARQIGSVEDFIKAIGTPHDQVWNEKIWNVVIQVDDLLAQAWMNYSFHLGEQLLHCGVNAIQFFKSEQGWQATHLTDTRRKNCDVSESE